MNISTIEQLVHDVAGKEVQGYIDSEYIVSDFDDYDINEFASMDLPSELMYEIKDRVEDTIKEYIKSGYLTEDDEITDDEIEDIIYEEWDNYRDEVVNDVNDQPFDSICGYDEEY